MKLHSTALTAALLASSAASALPMQSFFAPPSSGPSLSTLDIESATPFSRLTNRLLQPLSSLFEPRLVQTAHDAEPYWTNELGKHLLFYRGQSFMDLTDHPQLGLLSAQRLDAAKEPTFPEHVRFDKQLKPVFKGISDKGPRENLKAFTGFHTRYYKSETGKQSQKWLLSKVKETIGSHANITVREFEHAWGQNSIILHVPGRNASLSQSEGVTILGAHQDSTNFFPFFAAPGADDDGSGTVTIVEALRVLLEAGWHPETDVEWHWYSAEEGGLLGSQAVAASYEQEGRKVKAMLQQDMTAFVKAGTDEVVGIVSDFVSAPLAAFVTRLVKAYLDIPPVETKIGYAASDHASWSKIGAPSASAIEATYENSNLRRIHTTGDVFDIPEYSFRHLLQFVRLSTAFAVELGGWAQ
ncbi:uncharacterized protein PFL1_03398 [Pseudozyma flocculosa PF-1]|uniref:Peptide hydrolase n=2 Tax=Pseudozyma flocculosa TaxID=84751 RepID=A0A5C3F6E9_9BASI|nr:uncharacterized protein PFL1_03398 [Pseudozyma flocculosa PF-1]EPQ29110.1 hypothetical protein PFL1_03398 [Pseudozyma flocculosa PF-1]SPO40104.1 related to bacterial leucyl aminopeptidase precursor [Pseudozyma flocculosa]